MLNWAKQFNIFCFMDHNHYAVEPHRYECVLAAGVASSVDSRSQDDLSALGAFLQQGQWSFGHLAYEAGYRFFDLTLTHEDPVGFPLFYFFRPQYLLLVQGDQLHIEAPDAEAVYKAIMSQAEGAEWTTPSVTIQQRLSRQEYIEKVKTLQQHILRGDCYEVNFCQEFFAEGVDLDPVAVFHRLNAVSPNPFSVCYKLEDKYLLCASPERFLYKEGRRIVSQPIKGTAKRAIHNTELDEQLKKALRHSPKEQSENVMIVDLVRNDLSRVCREGSVQVDELFGIYSYPQVHQMISTISGALEEGKTFPDIVEATFPMGSMTGAPKKKGDGVDPPVRARVPGYLFRDRWVYQSQRGF